MDKVIKLAIVDDSDFFRKGLVSLLQANNNFQIIIESSNGQELIDVLKSGKHEPDIILLDLEMPVMGGTEAAQYLSKHYPKIKILVLTIHNEESIVRNLITKVNGFLAKDKSIDKVIDAVNVVHQHDFYFAGLDFKKIMADKKPASVSEIDFTKRELEVFKLICQQYTNKKISDKLFISIRTVHGHRTKILKKTKTRNAAELILYAMKHNLITPY